MGVTYIANGVDVNVVLSVLGVRDERLDEEVSQDTGDVLDLLLLGGTLSNPGLGLRPGLVQGKQTTLAAALDQLIRLSDELGAGLEKPGVGDLGLVENVLDVDIVGEVQRSQSRRSVVLGRDRQRAGLNGRSAGEVVVEDGLAVGLENRLGGHFAFRVVRRNKKAMWTSKARR